MRYRAHSCSACRHCKLQGPMMPLHLQGRGVSTKQMPWSAACVERCDILFAADILYDPGKAYLPSAHRISSRLPKLLCLNALARSHRW